jgi:uncharacterized OsmC-like protein
VSSWKKDDTAQIFYRIQIVIRLAIKEHMTVLVSDCEIETSGDDRTRKGAVLTPAIHVDMQKYQLLPLNTDNS